MRRKITHVRIIEEIIIDEGSRDNKQTDGLQNRKEHGQGILAAVETADELQTRMEQGQGIPTTD